MAKVKTDFRTTGTCTNNMRLFGLPYQFIESVDPRIDEVSSIIGKNYVNNIILDSPSVIIIPGKARFLPGDTNKEGTAHALLSAANGEIQPLIDGMSNDATDQLRYYDFEEDYTTYMKYVNMMCRTVAVFLELTDKIDGISLQAYDWKNYRWNADKYKSNAFGQASVAFKSTLWLLKNGVSAWMNGIKGTEPASISFGEDGQSISGIVGTNNFVQFYVDPSSGSSQSMSNGTTQSAIKGALDTASSTVKEFSFVANSVGAGDMLSGVENMTDSGIDALMNSMGGMNGKLGSAFKDILGSGKSVLKGDNIILPEVYQSSDYGIDYTIDIRLRSPYGNKFSVYMDVIVPMLHLIALCIPKQSTSNTYGSPFLIKAYYPGVFNCNLGIVESMQISRPSSEDAYSVDGLPTEVDVQLRIKDLYSDLTMSPTTEVTLFRNNTSLIDYLATVSGLDLIAPQIENKMNMTISAYTSGIRDFDDNIKSLIFDKIEKSFTGFTSL